MCGILYTVQMFISNTLTTINTFQHDHNILLEEVQSLTQSVQELNAQREQLAADLVVMETVCQQNETLQQDFNQVNYLY